MPGCPHKAGVTLVELLVSSAVLGISVISLLVGFTAAERVSHANAEALQAILMDAHLGELETIRLLRAIRTTAPTIPVVIMSGSVEEQIAEMFAAQPYDAFLAKPFTFAELKDCLATLVRTA